MYFIITATKVETIYIFTSIINNYIYGCRELFSAFTLINLIGVYVIPLVHCFSFIF